MGFSAFGQGNGNFLLDEVECTGSELFLQQCQHNGWRKHDCRSFEVAGVICKTGKGKPRRTCNRIFIYLPLVWLRGHTI